MHIHLGRPEPSKRYRLLDPKHDVVACAALVVAKIMIEAELLDLPRLQQRNGLTSPVRLFASLKTCPRAMATAYIAAISKTSSMPA